MMHSKNYGRKALVIGLVLGGGFLAAGEPATGSPRLTCSEMEAFLRDAKIGAERGTPKGVTQPKHAIFRLGDREHDAYIQTVHQDKVEFRSDRTSELNFKDFWEFNIAGYELAKILEVDRK